MKILESIQTFIERHTLSFLFFILGTLLIFLALTNSLDLPGLKGIVPYAAYRLVSLVLVIISVLLSILLYYLPLQGAKSIPDALRIPLLARRDKLLSRAQKQILGFIEEKTINNNHGIQQDIFEQKYNHRSKTETYYRLEQLWLLGFIEKEEIGKALNDLPRYIYRLSPEYRKAIGRR
ncbi:hypothetical protein [Fischerella sp. JS2]|uniref:hypothetical protein n=1 Tax=Fischerella sp. JS2 TaxID=2597771 RepID=UPI0028E61445|nr:hypothetical protein [Fischerella sp. JS2]